MCRRSSGGIVTTGFTVPLACFRWPREPLEHRIDIAIRIGPLKDAIPHARPAR
jgi:hypothetical protein